MSGNAIALLVVAVTVVWGGLAASIIALRRHPEVTEGSGAHPEGEDA